MYVHISSYTVFEHCSQWFVLLCFALLRTESVWLCVCECGGMKEKSQNVCYMLSEWMSIRELVIPNVIPLHRMSLPINVVFVLRTYVSIKLQAIESFRRSVFFPIETKKKKYFQFITLRKWLFSDWIFSNAESLRGAGMKDYSIDNFICHFSSATTNHLIE